MPKITITKNNGLKLTYDAIRVPKPARVKAIAVVPIIVSEPNRVLEAQAKRIEREKTHLPQRKNSTEASEYLIIDTAFNDHLLTGKGKSKK